MGRNRAKPPAPPGLGIIDSHAHLDSDCFGEERSAALARAWEAGLGGIVVVAAAGRKTVFREVADLVAGSPRLWMVAGVHPHDADRCADLWDAFLEIMNEGLPVGIGETGLDHFYNHSSPEGQRRSFRRHVELALERDLPLVLHVREAHREALALLDDYRRDGWTGVVHCFTGGPAEAEDWLARGFHLSIPGVVTFPARGAMAEAVPRIPKDRLLVETDSPYLAPAPWRGRRNEPARVVWTAQEIATLRDEEYEDLVRTTIRNTSKLFRIFFNSPLDIPEKLTIVS